MGIGDVVIVSVITLSSAATVQAAIHAYANRAPQLRREIRAVAHRYAIGELSRAEMDDRLEALRELKAASDYH